MPPKWPCAKKKTNHATKKVKKVRRSHMKIFKGYRGTSWGRTRSTKANKFLEGEVRYAHIHQNKHKLLHVLYTCRLCVRGWWVLNDTLFKARDSQLIKRAYTLSMFVWPYGLLRCHILVLLCSAWPATLWASSGYHFTADPDSPLEVSEKKPEEETDK